MRIPPIVLIAAVTATLAIGCSKTDSTTTAASGGTTTVPYAAPSTTTAKAAPNGPGSTTGTAPGTSLGAAAGATKVMVAESPLGKILVDGQGMTLYAFMKDTATTSACTASCTKAWPAVAGSSAAPGAGLDSGDFTSIKGADGSAQIVFYGHPLYTFAADSKPGQTGGQGLAGNWFVVGADGAPIQTKA